MCDLVEQSNVKHIKDDMNLDLLSYYMPYGVFKDTCSGDLYFASINKKLEPVDLFSGDYENIMEVFLLWTYDGYVFWDLLDT